MPWHTAQALILLHHLVIKETLDAGDDLPHFISLAFSFVTIAVLDTVLASTYDRSCEDGFPLDPHVGIFPKSTFPFILSILGHACFVLGFTTLLSQAFVLLYTDVGLWAVILLMVCEVCFVVGAQYLGIYTSPFLSPHSSPIVQPQYLFHCAIQLGRDQFVRANKTDTDNVWALYFDGMLWHLATYMGSAIVPVVQWRSPEVLGGLNFSLCESCVLRHRLQQGLSSHDRWG